MASKHQIPHLLHVVAVPYPAQGHINPLLQLCEQLVPRGFTFTFINTHHIHQRLHLARHAHRDDNGSSYDAFDLKDTCHSEGAHVSHAHEDEDGLHIRKPYDEHDAKATAADSHVDGQAHDVHRYRGRGSIKMVFIEGGCAPEQHAHLSTVLNALKAAQEMCEPVEQVLSHIMEERAVDFFMSDILLGWSSATARKFGMPWLSFWAASAASLSSFIYFSDLASQGNACIPFADLSDEEAPPFEGIPGLPTTSRCDVPKMWDAQGKLFEGACKYFRDMDHAFMVLLNSCEELEGQVLEALSERFPMQAVGPLLPPRYLLHPCPDNKEEGHVGRPSLFTEDVSCLAWLDTQAPSSVLFISFGSISLRSDAQLEELAKGVEASGCPFLWVCKPDISNQNRKSEERFSSHKNGAPRGLIVSWVPQLQVLSHPSVGGFITHCGWNSVVESTSMGVPMLCWADMGERMLNQRFVVEFWKCGIHVVSDARRGKQHIDEEVLVGRDDIEKSIRFLMYEEGGAAIRGNSAKLRDATIRSYQDSHVRMDQITETLKQRCDDLGSNMRSISS